MNYSHISLANTTNRSRICRQNFLDTCALPKSKFVDLILFAQKWILAWRWPSVWTNFWFQASPLLQGFTHRSLFTEKEFKEIKEHTEYFEPPTCEMKCVSFSTTPFEVIAFHLLKILLSMWFPTHNENLPSLTPTYSLGGQGSLYFLFSLISNPFAPAYLTSPLTSTFIK